VSGRFEASRPNELWPGDAPHGPHVAGRKTFLFAFLDDHSRAVMAARWGYFEDTVRLAAALCPALAARGVPGAIYVDYAGPADYADPGAKGLFTGMRSRKMSA
jgi:putative transposase